jgi:glycosyltransferase involved in cell wall biosynthesis
MSEYTKFNVIIPTRERADTLFYALKSISAQKYGNLEIWVSDNYSQDDTEEVVKRVGDSRIRYINTGRRISMSDNWEFALSHIKEGWAGFLGDDDGLMPDALVYLDKVISERKCEAVSCNFSNFSWPNNGFTDRARLNVPLRKGVLVRNSSAQLKKVLLGHIPYQQLPWLYHGGFAQIDTINRARNKGGLFFCSQIPDLYSAVALSCVTTEYLYILSPIAINGASRHSTGSSQFSKLGNRIPSEKFRSELNIPFHERLVLGKSLKILFYESYLQASHLHEDVFEVQLGEQLAIALAYAKHSVCNDVMNNCIEIAKKNGIDFSNKSFDYLKKRMIGLSVNAYQRIIHFLYNASIDCVDSKCDHIDNATEIAGLMYRRFGEIHPLRVWIHNIISRIFGRLRFPFVRE